MSLVGRIKVTLKARFVRGIVRFLPRLVAAIVNEVNRNSRPELVYAHLVAGSRDPVNTINFMSTDLSVEQSELWRIILSIRGISEECFNRLAGGRESLVSRELRLKLSLKLEIDEKRVIDRSRLVSVLEEYRKALPHVETPKQITMMVATLVVSRVRVQEVPATLEKVGLTIAQLTEFQKLKLLFRFDEAGDIELFRCYLNEVFGSLSKEGKLKAEFCERVVLGGDQHSYEKLEEQFCQLGYWVAREYKHRIVPAYRKIEPSRNFFSARFDKHARKKLQEIVIDHVSSRKSLCFLRLGDGECYGFPDYLYVNEQGVIRQEKHWWGASLDDRLRRTLQSEFVEAIKRADMLGLPSVSRLIRDFKLGKRGEYAPNSLICRLLCVMEAAAGYARDPFIVEDQSNLYLFDKEFITGTFLRAEKVVVVSGLDENLIKRWAPDRRKLTVLEIPTHRLLRSETFGSDLDGILPHVYEEYREKISYHSGPGVVFLISAGFIGKIFAAEAAKSGAVALDIGQSLISAVCSGEYEA